MAADGPAPSGAECKTARVEESIHGRSPGRNEEISEVHAGPDDPITIERDAMTANEALSSPTDRDHG